MESVRLGIIGCGVIGQRHLAAAAAWPGISLVAVADLREAVARETAVRFGVGQAYTDADALLADREIEGVVLALPARDRAALALRAFAAGKHVLTEKPVALDAGEVERLIAARGDRVAGCCSSRFRFLPSAAAACDLLASGALGRLRVVRCRAIKPAGPPQAVIPPAWRLSRALNGGGIMSNWGCYDLDYLLGITGWTLEPRTVLAQTWTVPDPFAGQVAPGSDAETHVAALIRCADGVTLTFERGEYVATEAEEAWQIIGDAGALRLRMTPGAGKTLWHDAADAARGVVSRAIWQGDEDYGMTHEGPARDFAAAIREGRQPLTSLEQALVVQRITDAIYRSAESGTAVAVG